ncbi:unnamed protein product [Brachionus calyciflorus]|uniref:Uncharacterized protein n=1 Tax=Brachionus calyciflorus TaxID=104777 RepID=A0A814D3T9_9BILA|nr:unnamed protein product [Brachionus calyciflorus]
MEESRDIMIHGIPNVTEANATLREILDQYYERFDLKNETFAPRGTRKSRVQRQLEELERYKQQVQERGAELTRENNRLKAEIEVSTQHRIALENQLTESQQLVQELLNRPTAIQETTRAWIPLPFRNLERRLQFNNQTQEPRLQHMPLRDMPQPPTKPQYD